MKAGDVFLGDYTGMLADGRATLPEEAVSGTYALGTVVMVARSAFEPGYILPGIPEWFPARVCLPPPIAGQWYRWYDPFIWYETEGPLHLEVEGTPVNMAYVGKLWGPGPYSNTRDQWCYPMAEWKRLFAVDGALGVPEGGAR